MRDIYCNLKDDDMLEKIGDALSSSIRRKILRLLTVKSYSALELASLTNVALSTMSFHLKILKDAKLINMVSSPNKRGNEKNISQSCENIYISFSQTCSHFIIIIIIIKNNCLLNPITSRKTSPDDSKNSKHSEDRAVISPKRVAKKPLLKASAN